MYDDTKGHTDSAESSTNDEPNESTRKKDYNFIRFIKRADDEYGYDGHDFSFALSNGFYPSFELYRMFMYEMLMPGSNFGLFYCTSRRKNGTDVLVILGVDSKPFTIQHLYKYKSTFKDILIKQAIAQPK